MSKLRFAVFISGALLFVTSPASFAAETSSPQATPSAAPSAHSLTQAQKDSIAAARATFEADKKNALEGFDRAIADAQAVRDQAISAAGADQNSIRIAKKNYRESYRTILNAYKLDLKNARSNLAKAIAAAKGANKAH